ncbi:fumarylacetoacetate hydrolase family protein [Pseudomonadota bacterium AL_CKDN230030165-1A_HGKHYDSX7]
MNALASAYADFALDATQDLPEDLDQALLIGRVWLGAPVNGPAVVVVRRGEVFDITAAAPTVSDLLERSDRVALARKADGPSLGRVTDLLARSGQAGQPRLLAPCDLQPVKAAGVTFAVSLLERLIEEQAGGDASQAETIRARLHELIGTDLSQLVPGSEQAMRLKAELQSRGQWSQYLEVGIGPDAEVFSKTPPMASVGSGAWIGLHPVSEWNNPEPEIVLAVTSRGEIAGAALGNDVNLRDIEGRSALLLTKAKDNNGSCAIGPFIRLIDEHYTLDDVRHADVSLRIDGTDGFVIDGVSHMAEISRDPADLVRQTCGTHHQYPDGFMLFLGTMFSPTQDRAGPGSGFTHREGDVVRIGSPRLGALVNRVARSDQIPPWTFGVRALYANLRERGL